MKRRTAAVVWPVVAILAVFALGFVMATGRRPEPAVVEVVTRAGPSAAASISLVMFGILGVFVLGTCGAVVVALGIRARQQTRRMEQAALLFGARQSQPSSRRQVRADSAPSVVVISGGQGVPRVEDLRNGYNG